nr:MAG TPA: hypothetical protein [Caudoviricetes sp.]
MVDSTYGEIKQLIYIFYEFKLNEFCSLCIDFIR